MSGTDKTSWLEGLEHDDGSGPESGQKARLYTENLQADWSDKTKVQGADARTMLSTQADSSKTQINFGGDPEDANAAMDDPVTGWLVVIKGPGQGQSVKIGIGMNTIGRSEEERVPMPFGDMQMSSKDHLRIIYDDQSRSFMVVPGTGKIVSRIKGQIVAMPMPLTNYEVIQLTKSTYVRFAAFCCENFDWTDVAADEGSAST